MTNSCVMHKQDSCRMRVVLFICVLHRPWLLTSLLFRSCFNCYMFFFLVFIRKFMQLTVSLYLHWQMTANTWNKEIE